MDYFQGIKVGDLMYSVDMVRLSLKTTVELAQDFMNRLSERDGEIVNVEYYQSYSEFKYRHLFTLKDIGSSSITIGLAPNDCKRVECIKGYIEFNPNKVAQDSKFQVIMRMIDSYFQEVQVKRWDWAIDIPVSREYVRMLKDQRLYTSIEGPKGNTVYLGRRSHDGFVKLYDKTKESDLDMPLTRLELTVEGLKPFSDINMPKVYITSPQLDLRAKFDLTGTDLVLVELLSCHEDLEMYLRKLGRKKSEKLKPYLLGEDTALKLDNNAYYKLLTQLKLYTKSQIL